MPNIEEKSGYNDQRLPAGKAPKKDKRL